MVWRHLLDGVDRGQRRWESVTAFAQDLGFPVSTTHKALAEAVRVGAVRVHPAGLVRVIDPFRLAVIWAGKRRLGVDIVDDYVTTMAVGDVERVALEQGAVLGGFRAIIEHIGANRIADYTTVLAYTSRPQQVRAFAPPVDDDASAGVRVLVAQPDPLLDRYGSFTPVHQAWVDLYSIPDWQSARFTDALAVEWLHDAA